MPEQQTQQTQPAAVEPQDTKLITPQTTPQTIPYERFTEVNQQLNDMKARNEFLEEQMLLYQNNQAQQQPVQQQQQQTAIDAIADDDFISGKQIKQIAGDFRNQMAEMRIYQQFPDIQDVLQKHLPNILKNNPKVAQALNTPFGLAVALYTLVTSDPEYKKLANPTQQIAQAAQAAIDAANRPGSPSTAGTAVGPPSLLNNQSMTDEQFDQAMRAQGL